MWQRVCAHHSRTNNGSADADPVPPQLHQRKGLIMSAADKIKNAAENVVGKGKEAVGNATDNDKLVAEGKADQAKASAKQAGENVKDAFKN